MNASLVPGIITVRIGFNNSAFGNCASEGQTLQSRRLKGVRNILWVRECAWD